MGGGVVKQPVLPGLLHHHQVLEETVFGGFTVTVLFFQQPLGAGEQVAKEVAPDLWQFVSQPGDELFLLRRQLDGEGVNLSHLVAPFLFRWPDRSK